MTDLRSEPCLLDTKFYSKTEIFVAVLSPGLFFKELAMQISVES